MEVKFENLIEKIKKDGVEEAERQAEQVLINARDKAKVILEQAGQEAEEMVEAARQQSLLFTSNAEEALRLSVRVKRVGFPHSAGTR